VPQEDVETEVRGGEGLSRGDEEGGQRNDITGGKKIK